MGTRMRILAIGGSVIKTAHDEIRKVAQRGLFDVLIHNGGSIFHDFQRATEVLNDHSYPLSELLDSYEPNRKASELVWDWIKRGGRAPVGSLTHTCEIRGMDVLLFTALGADFWQLFDMDWEYIALRAKKDFYFLRDLIMKEEFHYICMGSAVIHPEIFVKALASAKPKVFRGDVVDFKMMYRPKTRIVQLANSGRYWNMDHKTFLTNWLKSDDLKIDIFTGDGYENYLPPQQ